MVVTSGESGIVRMPLTVVVMLGEPRPAGWPGALVTRSGGVTHLPARCVCHARAPVMSATVLDGCLVRTVSAYVSLRHRGAGDGHIMCCATVTRQVRCTAPGIRVSEAAPSIEGAWP